MTTRSFWNRSELVPRLSPAVGVVAAAAVDIDFDDTRNLLAAAAAAAEAVPVAPVLAAMSQK